MQVKIFAKPLRFLEGALCFFVMGVEIGPEDVVLKVFDSDGTLLVARGCFNRRGVGADDARLFRQRSEGNVPVA